MNMEFDMAYVWRFTKEILETHSPSGYTGEVMERIRQEAEALGFFFRMTNKGGGVITVPGRESAAVGLCAHIDTLGLMVRSVKSNGTLAVAPIGGPLLPTLDGEYCTIITRQGRRYTGTILSNSPATHVYKDAAKLERTAENLHVRIDQVVKNKTDVKNLGIGTGDFVCIDTKTTVTDGGFIKSRFLDDKLSVGVLFGVLQYISRMKIQPERTVVVLISAYEEVGHGMSAIPEGITELLAVDMGCIGDDLACTEYDVSICPKDSSGPYDFELTNRLIGLAKDNRLRYAVDLYPYYGSDVSAALRGGHDIKGALIGPGVHASHGMERSHELAVVNSMMLIGLYLGL